MKQRIFENTKEGIYFNAKAYSTPISENHFSIIRNGLSHSEEMIGLDDLTKENGWTEIVPIGSRLDMDELIKAIHHYQDEANEKIIEYIRLRS